MRSKPRLSMSVFTLVAAALFPLAARAAHSLHEPIGQLIATAAAVEWQPASDYASIVLSLQRPDGSVRTETFASGQNPIVRVENLSDGVYAYELHAVPRRVASDAMNEQSLVQSGSFMVRSGAIVPPNLRETAVAARPPLKPATDTFFASDVSATGGLCGGADCTSAESYGLSAVKVKANNTRLKFEDTSTSVGFAATDWQLTANDTGSGGANKFSVEDLTAATVPFVIEGASPTNTLYVDSTGRIGIRTSTPAKDLTISVPLSPTIRMEQSASPFQVWDVVANHNNFYVRDVSHESDPFIILADAPYNSIVIDASGRIGLGVAAPSYQIHHSSGARLDAGVWVDASSRKVKQDIHQLDRDAAFDALQSLQPVTFAYKSNPTDMHVGFIAEDVPELVATPDRTGLAPMDVVAVLTKIVQEQQKTIADMHARLERLEQK
ncbi:MAG TPA: tail fiber domain-containing protein [Thermoanaerobaculia bacterium]|nr:tail fiber domain-containing protein [Thermoanaerobaculia bacterium]